MTRKITSLVTLLAFLSNFSAFAVGKIQNEDVKSETDLTNAGSTKAHLINDAKIYVTANGINDRLDSAIAAGTLGGVGGGGVELLSNPSFENGTVQTGWTTSTATTTNETSTVYSGKQSAKVSVTAQAGSFSQSVTPTPVNTLNINMEASCKVLTTLATVSLCGLSNALEQNCQSVPATGAWQYVTANFVGPSNGTTVGVEVKNTTDTGSYFVDDCYVGPARNLDQISQAQAVGLAFWPATASCNWTRTSIDSFSAFSAVSACTSPAGANLEGTATAPATKIPAISFPSLGAGTYRVHAAGTFLTNTAGQQCQWAITDGTTVRHAGGIGSGTSSTTTEANSLEASFTYGTPQSNVTFQIQGTGDAGSAACAVQNAATSQGLTLWVDFLPNQQQSAIRLDATPASYAAAFTTSGCSTTSGSLADITNCSAPALTTRGTPRNITCSTTASQLGITCTLPRGGNYRVKAAGSITLTGSGATFQTEITDGSNVVISGPQSSSILTTSFSQPWFHDGIYNATSAGSFSFKLRADTNTGTVTFDGSSVEWSVTEMDAPQAAPVLVNSVTSNSSGLERIDRVSLTTTCSSSPCTIGSQSGSWVTSITRAATGDYTINFAAGEFSSAPTCTIGGSNATDIQAFTSISTSSARILNFAPNTTILSDGKFGVICMGPH